jgi:hypothetical protein
MYNFLVNTNDFFFQLKYLSIIFFESYDISCIVIIKWPEMLSELKIYDFIQLLKQ